MNSSTPYRSEERFIELFQDVFGPSAAAKLEQQFPYVDIEDRARFIDFALESLVDRYAIEIDGETYHHPAVLTHEQMADHLLRQNSLVHLGWNVLRWTDWQLQHRQDEVKQHLSLLLGTAVQLVVPQEHLPQKRGALLDLYEHQQQALDRLQAMRAEGMQIALLAHAVGTGKTTTAVDDARRMGLRTLFLAHTHELIDQALARFAALWPEATRARLGDAGDEKAHVVVGSIQRMNNNLRQFAPDHFGYVVIDEAHHATARSYQAVLRYFNPAFLLGLTGTEIRADGLSALEVFRSAAHRMNLETAVKSGVLCDVRCFRVETSVDLRSLRFNGAVYRIADLERRVTIPERNQLIVDTYLNNVQGRRGVCFCVSVAHAEEMAARFRAAGVEARCVSGSMPREQRADALTAYREGTVRVLCACDVLNEGWDAPETEVLLMARPTLSRVIYQQQLGRGMRLHEGKQYLILFDFVDVFSRDNRALSLHRLLKRAQYRAGRTVFSEDDSDPEELALHLWVRDLQTVDIFDWQERVEGMVTMAALARRLRVDDGWVQLRWKRDELPADEVVDLGDDRRIPYFSADRVAEIRAKYGLREVTDENLYEDFLEFLADMNMSASYKPVWFLALLSRADERGRARVSEVRDAFHQFYRERAERAELVESASAAMAKALSISSEAVQRTINSGPFDRFNRKDYVTYGRDRAYYEIHPVLWKRLKDPAERKRAEEFCQIGIRKYFERISQPEDGDL